MSVKVKCQHCWKIFEVSEDAIGKQKSCTYCSRPTLLKPAEDANSEYVMENTLEHKTKLLQVFSLVILGITLLNLFLLFFLVKNQISESNFQESYSQQVEWQKNIEKQIKSMQQKVEDFERNLQQIANNSKQGTSEINATFVSMMDNLNIKLEQIGNKIEQVNQSAKQK